MEMSLADQLSYRPITKKEKKWKIHLGGVEKERTKARAGEMMMMMMLSFALCTADHIPLRRGHYN